LWYSSQVTGGSPAFSRSTIGKPQQTIALSALRNFGSSGNRFRDQSRILPLESIIVIARKPSSFVPKIQFPMIERKRLTNYTAATARGVVNKTLTNDAYLLNVLAHGTWNDQRLVEIATSN
jgi:hypothetical protein